MFEVTNDHKRTYVRILCVHICFGKPVQRARDLVYSLSAHVRVSLSRANAAMPWQLLNVPDLEAIFRHRRAYQHRSWTFPSGDDVEHPVSVRDCPNPQTARSGQATHSGLFRHMHFPCWTISA